MAGLKKHLSALGHDPNYLIVDRLSLLHYAAFYNAHECAAYLIQKGANANAAGVNGVTPLHYAAFQGSWETADLLLKNGAKRDAEDAAGFNPLEFAEKAVKRGRQEGKDTIRHQNIIELLRGR